MIQKKKNEIKTAAELASEIFESKKDFHRNQAKLPIEEKIKILVELQKIVVKTQERKKDDELRIVWKI
jgi:hypothetical protein